MALSCALNKKKLTKIFPQKNTHPLCLLSFNMRTQQQQQEDHMNQQQSRVLYELCSMIIQILKSPPPLAIPIPNTYSVVGPSASSGRQQPVVEAISQVSPAAFASLFLGISIALMLFGSITFVIGFILMPWVIALVLFFYFLGVLSNFSSIFCSKDMPDCQRANFDEAEA